MKDKLRKNINRRTYVFIDGKWVNERSDQELDPHDPDYRTAWDIKIKL